MKWLPPLKAPAQLTLMSSVVLKSVRVTNTWHYLGKQSLETHQPALTLFSHHVGRFPMPSLLQPVALYHSPGGNQAGHVSEVSSLH